MGALVTLEDSTRRRCAVGLHVAAAVQAASSAFLMLDGSLFGAHTTAMTLAYALLMAEAVLLALNFRKVATADARIAAIQRHMVVNLAALSFAAVGFFSIYANKSRMGKAHFQSLHAKLGLTAFLCSAAIVLSGAASFRKLGILQYVPQHLQAMVKYGHRVVSRRSRDSRRRSYRG